MDIKGLQYFITAAERLNFTVAAKECYITQTAMSLHIKKMEDELGFKLFIRNKHTTELTEAGRDFHVRARGLILEYESAVRHAASVGNGVTGIISITVPSSIEGFVLMDRLRVFRAANPGVEVNLYVEPPGRHIGSIKSGRTDICVGAPDDMDLDPDFVVERLREDPIVVVCSIRHPFARLGSVKADMLQKEPTILCGPKGIPNTFRTLRNSRMQSGLDSGSIISVNNMDEMLLLIELERGIGFLPSFVSDRVAIEKSGIAFVQCDYNGRTPTMTTAVGYLKNNPNPVLKNMMNTLLQK
ncbi:MAG: LysR family transcriptional regulator [Oscillospiraceae bacterium]|jgi:DNA-binding transcriptional LysR family regulator|nr:LysR family transcriptional regulator [Oscillospiraceae bacterium]